MKTLYFCRHAKSDWSTSLPDHERPLNDRGHKSIPVIAQAWSTHGEIPGYWVSSSAVRALRTAQLMATKFKFTISIKVVHSLYHAGMDEWQNQIDILPDDLNAVAFFGHNPGITDIVNYLSGSDISNIPTCGLVRIDFEIDDWRLISRDSGKLAWFEYPKRYGEFR